MKTRKKENIIIIVILVVMLMAIIGVSYATFSFSKAGNTPNKITTGSITMTYEESDNTITLGNALPTTDATGTTRLKDGEYFDFTVSGEIVGDVNINYEISAKEVGDGTIDGSNIKLYLTRLTDDGEEQLMSPEVYNEETTSNTFTGRPSGEMSLYTSSMNASESNNYRLRMYVTEEYNPQGDGGGLTFTVKVNVYGKVGDKYIPLTTQKILKDNELQEEKENMFNYTSSGIHDWSSEPDSEYITNGLYSAEDEDGVSYYFRGNVDNNNVQFGTYDSDYYVYQYKVSDNYSNYDLYFQSLASCQEYNSSCSESNRVKLASAGDKMYWKIVRVNGDGSLRLIYNGTSTTPDYSDLSNSYAIGSTPYNLERNDPKYTGYTYDRDTNETDSFIKREVDTWYKNTIGSNNIYDSKVIGGRFCNDSSHYQVDSSKTNFASFDRLDQAENDFEKPNAPTLRCPTTTESYGGSYRLKAGLITADELALAGSLPYMSDESDNYLSAGSDAARYWTMTPSDSSTYGNYMWTEYNYLDSYLVDNITAFKVRPVINVSIPGNFSSGDGTATNPYVIE